MVMQSRPPIIFNDDGDVMAAETQEDAEHFLEPPDVRKGAYEAFDSTGRLLKATLTDDGFRARTALHATDTRDPARLRQVIRSYLTRAGHPLASRNLDEQPLQVLLEALPRIR